MLGTVEANTQLATTYSDSDDDLPVVSKKRGNAPKLFESDSESEAASVNKTLQPGSDENDNDVTSSTEKVHNLLLTNGDTDSDLDSIESKKEPDENEKGRRKLRPQLFDSDEESNEEKASTKDTWPDGSEGKIVQKKRPSSLFDSDRESNSEKSDDEGSSESSHSDGENVEGEMLGDTLQQSELFDTEEPEAPKEISESLKKKLAKGAAKKSGSRRATTGMRKDPDELMQIHSESQRIVRESRVRLPYHQPKPKSLAEILARTKEKQEKIKANETRLMMNKNKDPLSFHNAKVDLTRTNQIKTVDDGLPSLRERVTARKKTSPKQAELPKTCNKVLPNSQEYDLQTPLADDELPDLSSALISVNQPVLSDRVCGDSVEVKKVVAASGCDHTDAGDRTLVDRSDKEGEKDVTEMSQVKEVSSILQQGETQGLHLELEMSEQQDSEQVMPLEMETQALHLELDVSQSVPQVTDCDITEKLNPPSVSKLSPKKVSDFTSNGLSTEQTGSTSENLPKEQIRSATKLSPKDKRERLKAQLAEKLKGLTPKLSGPQDNMIDLDNGDETPVSDRKPAGMTKLMQRLQKHSLKKKKRSRDIEISMVKKETVDGEREELRLEKMTVHVEDDAGSQDHMPPGGRWDKVKQKLAAALKVKREEARKRRSELYELENEEGFEERMEEEKEEAELTDQTDTEESEGEEAGGIDWEDEEDDDDYEPGMDVDRERKKSVFVDEEAEEDGDEYDGDTEDEVSDTGDIEPEDLKLHLDQDSDDEDEEKPEAEATTISESTAESAHQSVVSDVTADSTADSMVKSVRPAIVHTSVLDEDAISHSPLSQQDHKGGGKDECNTVTDRPFQQLSQNKVLEGEAEEESPDKSVNVPVEVVCDGSLLSGDASFDLTSSLIPAGQRSSSKSQRDLTTPDFFRARSRVGRDTPELFSTSSKMSTNSTASSGTRKFDDLTLPIEDSQLFSSKATPPKGADSLSADTNSRWLDDDGFLKPAKRQLHLEDAEPGTRENMDELLGLCSGKFTGEHTEKSMSNVSSLGFGSQLPSTQSNMDELLGLCSGQFTGRSLSQKNSCTQASTGFNAIEGLQSLGTQGQSSQANMSELLGLCSGTFRTSSPTPEVKDDSPRKPSQRKRKRTMAVVSDDDEEFEVKEGSDAGQVVDDALAETGGFGESGDEMEQVDADSDSEKENQDQEEAEERHQFTGFKTKKGKMRKEFLEVEAELSGSEYDSDENLDLDERDDIMEEEEGDRDELGITEEELRNQVGRVHLKGMIDEDKRQIRLMQEMYLADGDLHSDSNGRLRRFRWRDIDDIDGGGLLGGDSDNENHPDEENELDQKWRLERYEREKFIQEQSESMQDSQDSQLLKLGKVLLKRQFSHTRSKSLQEKPASKIATPTTAEPASTQKLSSKGSLLSRNKATLDKIAQLAKPMTNPNGTRHSRNFVFSALSPDAKPSKPQLQRATSKIEPAAKRPKLERSNSLPTKSIFKHI